MKNPEIVALYDF